MHNISVDTKISYGATYNGIASIRTNTPAQWNSTVYPMFGKGAIFELTNDTSFITKSYSEADKKTTIKIYGEACDNPGTLKIKSPFGTDIDISTENLFFGISYNVRIELTKNSKFTARYKYKMLPGSELVIQEGAIFNLNGKLIIYNDWKDSHEMSGYKLAVYPHDLPNGTIVNKGTINVNGYIGGNLSNSNNAKYAILNLSSAAGLTVSAVEGYNDDKLGALSGKIIKTYEDTLNANDNGINLDEHEYIWNGTNWVNNNFAFNIKSNSLSFFFTIVQQNYLSTLFCLYIQLIKLHIFYL